MSHAFLIVCDYILFIEQGNVMGIFKFFTEVGFICFSKGIAVEHDLNT